MSNEIERASHDEEVRPARRPSHLVRTTIERETDIESVAAFEPDPAPEPPARTPAVKALLVAVCVAVALLSIFLVAPLASSPKTYSGTIQALDKKAETVTGLVAVSTTTSTAITLIPGDVGTPIADELADLSSDFLIVLAAIFLEKYLLTIFGRAAFVVLVPIVCALLAASVLFERGSWVPAARHLAVKLFLFAVAILFVVPVSVGISNTIEATYAADTEGVSAFASQLSDIADDAAAVADDAAATDAAAASSGDVTTNTTADQTPLEAFTAWLTGVGQGASSAIGGAVDSVTTGATEVVERAKSVLNGMVEALAVMIVTSCVIPILVLVFFIWLANTILGLDVGMPTGVIGSRGLMRTRASGRR